MSRKKQKNDVTVVQSNDLIDTPRDLTLREYKLFLFLVSNINPIDDKEFRTIRVNVDDFADALGIKKDKNVYESLRETTKQLMTRVIHIPKELNGKIMQTHFISDTCYYIGKGYIELTISPTMTPLLLELKDRFTSYKLSNIKHLTSIYSIRIYEMAKSFEGLGNRVFSLEDLRCKAGVNNGELKNFAHFNEKVLKIAEREINAKTDMRLSYEPIKEGRKVTQVKFKVKFVKSSKPETEIIQLPLRKKGNCETIGNAADNLLVNFNPTNTTNKKRALRVSSCKKVSKTVSMENKTANKKTVVQAEKPKIKEVLELQLSSWQRLKYMFKKAFKE